MRDPARLTGYLALAALAVVTIAPPEAYGSGRMLLVVIATFGFLAAAVDGRIPRAYLAGGSAILTLLLAHSLWLSQDLNRSLEFLGLAWAYYCLFAVFRYSEHDPRYRASFVLVLLASLVSLYGLYQYFWGFDDAYAFVQNSQATEAIRTSILSRLSSERVFSTFALPGTLWGFLILTIPLHAILWGQTTHRWQRPLLVANALLVVLVAGLTQSYGFVLGLLVVLGGWAVTQQRMRLGRAALTSLLLVPLAGGIVGLLYVARAGTHNPVWLRLQNWLSAWDMFVANPLGSGVNTYAALYLQHQQPGANETQFAHNTPLQLIGELGVSGLILMVAFAVFLLMRVHVLRSITGVRRFLLLALFVWGVHNLIDINVYFGGIGAVGASLVGLFMWSATTPEQHAERTQSRRALAATSVFATFFLISSGVIYVSGELLFRAKSELEFSRLSDASATLQTAALINPLDSSIMHEAGQTEFELYHATREAGHLEAARDYFSRAIKLSPQKVGPHIGLALCFSTENRLDEALQELEVAQILHPQGTQASNIRRMIEAQRDDLRGRAKR